MARAQPFFRLVATALLVALNAVTAGAGAVNITVRSAGWEDGNLAEFFLDGAPADFDTGRGLNLLVLHPDGSVRFARTFDTHENTSASSELASLLGGLERGALVAVAARDDASASLQEEARTALEQCCFAQEANNISSRSSYLLVAVNGISALAERRSAGGEGAVEATAFYGGVGPLDGFSLAVRSRGSDDSEMAEFYSNGEIMDCTAGTGLNVATLGASGDLAGCQLFETHRNSSASEALAAYLDALVDGTPVLVAASGEAAGNLTAVATSALARCGGTFASSLGLRDSYALVGITGGHALAEKLAPAGSGGAEVVLAGALVKSAGWDDGNVAEFYTNGERLQVPTGRGLNVVVLNQDGSKNASHTFDTHKAGGADELVQMVDGLVEGTPVLVAARDEASAKLDEAGLLALEALGARSIRSLDSRDSFALIGARGAARPMAELAVRHGSGPAVVAASWLTNASLPMPRCGIFECPLDTILKEDAWNIEGHTSSECCQERAPDMMSLAVESAGWDDGNFARFYADDKPLSIATGRGLVVVVLRGDGSVESSSVFDTDAGGSDALAAFVASIEDGRPVLVAATDEAAANLTAVAREALKSCGATHIDKLSWRGSYALVGIKWSEALAERVTTRGSGPAQVVAHYKKVVTAEAPKPVCDGRSAEPPVKGYLSNGQLNLEANCRYELWQSSQALTCLEGAWVVVPGGSNTILMTINLANLLVPGALSPIDDHASMGSATIIDLVIEDGNVTYKNSVKLEDCTPEPFDQACRSGIIAEVAKVPPYSPNATRITQFVAQYWDQVDAALDAVEADTAWAQGEVALVTQVSAWYIYCSVKGVDWCPREELLSKMDEAGLDNFVSDMTPVVDRLESFCAPGGRAGVRGCVVGTTSWQNPPPGHQAIWYGRYNDAIKEAVHPIASPTLRLVDFWELGMAMPTECIGGHGSPVANIWSWQVMLAGFCSKGEAADSSFAAFEGAMCYAADAEMSKCPYYKKECPNTFRCERWECASSVPCTLSATEPPKTQEAAYLGVSVTVQNIDFGLLSANASLRIAFSSAAQRIVAEQAGHGVGPGDVQITLEEGSVRIRAKVAAPDDDGLIAMNAELRASSAGLTSALLDGVAGLEGIGQATTGTLKIVDVDVSIQGDLEACDAAIVTDFPEAATVHGDSPCGRLWCWEARTSEYVMAAVGAGAVAMLFIGMQAWSRLFEPLLPPRLRARPKAAAKQKAAPEPPAAAALPATREEPQSRATHTDPAAGVAMAQGRDAEEDATMQCHSLPVSPKSPHRAEVAITVAAIASNAGADGAAGAAATDARMAADAAAVIEAKEAKEPTAEGLTAKTKSGAAAGKNNLAKGKVAGDRFPLGMARFMASIHVVVGHVYAKGVTSSVYFFGWGFTWVPWFFMLSGFVLFTAHLRRPKEERIFDYVMRRSVTIYPLYAVSLLPAFAIDWYFGRTPGTDVLVAQSFLAQAWCPLWAEHALQQHCWFLSCMVVYWLCFKPLSYCLKNLSLRGTCTMMLALFFIPWLQIIIPEAAQESTEWYKAHSWGATDSFVDIAVVVMKFSPICYAHVFILGMLLAKLRLLLDDKACAAAEPDSEGVCHIPRRWRLPLEFVLPFGYLGLAAVFLQPDIEGSLAWVSSWGYKLTARLSVLLPFQAAVLFGLAGLPSLPLPRMAFLMSNLDWLQNYSYCVYVCQWLCYDVWPKSGQINLLAFLVFVVFTAVVVSHTVQKPVEKWWAGHPRGRMALPFLLAALLAGLNAVPSPSSAETAAPDLPPFVRLDEHMVDVRLPTVDEEGSGDTLINPSLLVQDGQIVVVARRHGLEYRRWNGEWNGSMVTYVDKIWRSQIVMGTAPLDADAWSGWATNGTTPFSASLSAWSGLQNASSQPWTKLCAREKYLPENNTVVRQIVSGPEDAKVFDVNGSSIDIAFSSLPPLGLDGCPDGEEVPQMYLATDVSPSLANAEVVGHRLQCGRTDVAEKNWIPFTHDGELFFVYSPVPHTVLSAAADGTCERRFSTEFVPFKNLLQESPELDIRGSGQAVLVDDPETTPNLPQRHYLAMIHMFNKTSSTYAHFAYRFSPSPPFAILQVSSQLSLLSAKADIGGPAFAFVSGLAVHNRTVAISYGAGDRDARALVLTLSRLDELFATCGPANSSAAAAAAVGAPNATAGGGDGGAAAAAGGAA